MELLDDMRQQRAVYWPPSGTTDEHGTPVWGTPRELRVRWERKQEERIAANGTTITSKSRVFVAVDLEEGGVLWEGALKDLPTPARTDPFRAPGAWQIQSLEKIPTLDNEDAVRIAYL